VTQHAIETRRTTRGAATAIGFAALWSVGLLVAAMTAPAYERETGTSSGEVVRGSATFLEVNGRWGLVVAAFPLLATILVGWLLRGGRSNRAAVRAGWVVTGALTVISLLAMLTVGVYFLPVALALGISCALPAAPPERPTP
jgi:hypothetical protein